MYLRTIKTRTPIGSVRLETAPTGGVRKSYREIKVFPYYLSYAIVDSKASGIWL